MTAEQFNNKYKNYLTEGFGGLEFDIPEITEMLDKEFQEFIKVPGFCYQQIKLKFNMARFYADGIPSEDTYRVEDKINEMRGIRV